MEKKKKTETLNSGKQFFFFVSIYDLHNVTYLTAIISSINVCKYNVVCHINILYAHKHIPAAHKQYWHHFAMCHGAGIGGVDNLSIQIEHGKWRKEDWNIGLHSCVWYIFVPENCSHSLTHSVINIKINPSIWPTKIPPTFILTVRNLMWYLRACVHELVRIFCVYKADYISTNTYIYTYTYTYTYTKHKQHPSLTKTFKSILVG